MATSKKIQNDLRKRVGNSGGVTDATVRYFVGCSGSICQEGDQSEFWV
jgi:hypothetical protein